MPRKSTARNLEKSAPERGQLSADRILAVAIQLMDREGMDALTMRRLGAELGVEAMSLYRYFRSKEELLEAASNALFGEIKDPAPSSEPIDALRQVMLSFYEVAERHPSMVDLLFRGSFTAKRARGAADRAVIACAGFGDDAPLVLRALIAYVIGALRQRRAGTRKSREQSFRFGLEMLLTGIKSEAERRNSTAGAEPA